MSDPSLPVVIVSGGSRGIGLAIVRRLLTTHRVATFGRSAASEVAGLFRGEDSDRLLYRSLDASDSDAVRRYVAQVEDRFGRIDALVNNAAVAIDGVLPLAREEDIARMLDINLKSVIVLTKECVRSMLLRGEGAIVSISSIIAERGFSGLSTYAATKAGLLGMTRALARELGPRNIRVNALSPGYVDTDMSEALTESQRGQIVRRTPLGRLATVDDIVPVVEFLLSAPSRFITGQNIIVDGGASV